MHGLSKDVSSLCHSHRNKQLLVLPVANWNKEKLPNFKGKWEPLASTHCWIPCSGCILLIGWDECRNNPITPLSQSEVWVGDRDRWAVVAPLAHLYLDPTCGQACQRITSWLSKHQRNDRVRQYAQSDVNTDVKVMIDETIWHHPSPLYISKPW